MNDRSEMTSNDEIIKSKIKMPYHYKRIGAFNSRFILSCTSLKDNLNQWRLYGNDGKGICLELEISEAFDEKTFLISKIFYNKKIILELQKLIAKIYNTYRVVLFLRKLNFWNCFMKVSDYAEGKELRLLYNNKGTSQKIDWSINKYGLLSKYMYFNLDDFPLTIRKIILGPKVNEPELNQAQLKYFLKENGVAKSINVEISKITHYR